MQFDAESAFDASTRHGMFVRHRLVGWRPSLVTIKLSSNQKLSLAIVSQVLPFTRSPSRLQGWLRNVPDQCGGPFGGVRFADFWFGLTSLSQGHSLTLGVVNAKKAWPRTSVPTKISPGSRVETLAALAIILFCKQ